MTNGFTLQTDDFGYSLPLERIASHPPPRRDESRLLILDRSQGLLEHLRFTNLPKVLRPGDLLVLNDTRVLPARLKARRATGGAVEVLLFRKRAPSRWRALLKPSRKVRIGTRLTFANGVVAIPLSRDAEGTWEIELNGDAETLMREEGRTPLPPYIKREPDALDGERYQTVYARAPGSIAAPTAGLHFTKEILESLSQVGISWVTITLHIGPGTFRSVIVNDIGKHRMEPEWFDIGEDAVRTLEQARTRGRRIVAVGTTSCRALEAWARTQTCSGWTDLFIHPPFEFQRVGALLTNFHLPRSTLLMLTCAFAGRERILSAYQEAIRQNYRFYSYGDAMLIL